MTLGTHTGVCDNLEGWDGEGEGRKVQERRTFMADYIDILQKTAKFCKAIILKLKPKKKKRPLLVTWVSSFFSNSVFILKNIQVT